LRELDPSWGAKAEEEIEEILRSSPYNDT
jgi:hypothetical protein